MMLHKSNSIVEEDEICDDDDDDVSSETRLITNIHEVSLVETPPT